jgi:hypothetical protein
MGLRVAIDLDGTVADLSRAMHDIAKKKFRKLQEAPADTPAPEGDGALPMERPSLGDLGLSEAEVDRLWRHVLTIRNFWTTLPEIESGIVRRIQQLADERRWDVLFITTRPTAAGRTTQVQSQDWLAAHGFRHPSVYVVKGRRGRVAAALDLDAVIDDRPENVLDVALDSTARPILVWTRPLDTLPAVAQGPGVVVAASIGQALDVVIDMDREKRGGVVRRIKRLFGKS